MSADGETEPVAEVTNPSPTPPRNTDARQQEQHVIASPNPTVDESKASAVEPSKVSASKVQPAAPATAAPMKKKKKATRPKRRRARPRTE